MPKKTSSRGTASTKRSRDKSSKSTDNAKESETVANTPKRSTRRKQTTTINKNALSSPPRIIIRKHNSNSDRSTDSVDTSDDSIISTEATDSDDDDDPDEGRGNNSIAVAPCIYRELDQLIDVAGVQSSLLFKYFAAPCHYTVDWTSNTRARQKINFCSDVHATHTKTFPHYHHAVVNSQRDAVALRKGRESGYSCGAARKSPSFSYNYRTLGPNTVDRPHTEPHQRGFVRRFLNAALVYFDNHEYGAPTDYRHANFVSSVA